MSSSVRLGLWKKATSEKGPMPAGTRVWADASGSQGGET